MGKFIKLEIQQEILTGPDGMSVRYEWEEEYININHIVKFFAPAKFLYLSDGSRNILSEKSANKLIKFMEQ